MLDTAKMAAANNSAASQGEGEWVVVRCWHCRSTVRVLRQNLRYWRCGVCRRVNGRPTYARGLAGLAQCGLCRFYASRLVHGIAISLMSGIIGFGLGVALPMASSSYSTVPMAASWSTSIALAANVVYHFVLAARSDPGRVPKLSRERWAQLIEDETMARRLPWCKICDNLKPPRAHHCSTCSTCVVEMDHHCVFLHNCVGAGNMAYFARLLLAILAGTVFATTYAGGLVLSAFVSGNTDMRAAALARIANRHPNAVLAIPEASRYIIATRDGRYIAIAAVCAGVACGVGVLSAVTLRAVALGETALERSARLWRAGPDYRQKQLSLSGLARHLFEPTRHTAADHAAAVAAKLLDDDRAALDRHLTDEGENNGSAETQSSGCFLRRKKRA